MENCSAKPEPKPCFIDIPYFAEMLCETEDYRRNRLARHNADGSLYTGGPPTEEELRRGWFVVRPGTLRAWVRYHPGTRPAGWWKFEAPEPRDESAETEVEYLTRHALLEDMETRALQPGRVCFSPGDEYL